MKNSHTCPKCGSTHIDKLQRITGYLVKRSEMEKFRAHQVVLQNTTHLGTANYDVNRLAQRKVRMV